MSAFGAERACGAPGSAAMPGVPRAGPRSSKTAHQANEVSARLERREGVKDQRLISRKSAKNEKENGK